MKKLASALLALFMLVQPLVDVAHARLLIIEDKKTDASGFNDESSDVSVGTHVLRNVIASLVRQYGLRQGRDYDIVSVGRRGMTAAQVRRGNVIDKPDDPNSTVTTYDAAILINYNGFNSSSVAGSFRADSLRKFIDTNNYNRIPLMIVNYGSGGTALVDSSAYGNDVTYMGTMGQVMYSTKDPSIRFRTGVNKVGEKEGDPAGMERVLVGASSGRSEGTQQDIQGVASTEFPCIWCDSVYTTSPGVGDSAIVWMRYFDHVPGAKPIIYSQSNDYAGTALNIPALWVGLAMLDSLAGGAVFSGATRTPEFGILVPGLASRGAAVGFPSSTGGLVADDTTNTYRAMGDSLATLGVPIAFGAPVNMDSVLSYKRDIQYVMSKSSRFSLFPFQRFGLDTAQADLGTNGRTACDRPTDLWGAWRNRTAIGDGTMVGADSSLYSHVKLAFARLDSLYPGRVDHALYAPLDDWTPKSYARIGPDSLYSALAYGGARAVVTNFRIANAQLGKPVTSRQGARWTTGKERAPYAFGGTSVNVLAAAPIDSGSARFDNGNGQVGTHGGFDTFKAIDRFWLGLVVGRNSPQYGYSYDSWSADSSNAFVRTLVVPVAAFGSGNRADMATLPTRPGWWYTKAIVNATKVINSYGYPGRTYVRVAKVEDVQP